MILNNQGAQSGNLARAPETIDPSLCLAGTLQLQRLYGVTGAGGLLSEEMIDNVKRADATLTELEVINELASAVEIGHRLAELTKQHVRETATLLAAVRRRHFVKRDSLEFE